MSAVSLATACDKLQAEIFYGGAIMKRLIFAILSIFLLTACGGAPESTQAELLDPYSANFSGETLRIDLLHSGDVTTSKYAMDAMMVEGGWPGSRTKLIDTLNVGNSMFYIYDAESGEMIYSRGFSTMFGEWQTTAEAKEKITTMSETIRLPLPRKAFTLSVAERDEKNEFVELFRLILDPAEAPVKSNPMVKTFDLHVPNADPAMTYDIVILPDGYTEAEQDKLLADAQRAANYFLEVAPFSDMADRLAVRTVGIISAESGIDEPRQDIYKDTALGTSFNSFGSARYVLSLENKTMRDYAATVPYEIIIIMFNMDRYGGGGIYNLFTTFAADAEEAQFLLLHESGHSIAGLGDEYYSSDVAYEEFYDLSVEPWEANVTALLDPENIKWKEFLTPGVPIPTPNTEEYADVIGVFEGAGYMTKGLYRPTLSSIMIDKQLDFRAVNSAAVVEVLKFYTDENK
jgi:hypothetical protein